MTNKKQFSNHMIVCNNESKISLIDNLDQIDKNNSITEYSITNKNKNSSLSNLTKTEIENTSNNQYL